MGLENEIAKAARLMSALPKDVQVEIVNILISAGIDKCLEEQAKIRAEHDALIKAAYRGKVQ